MSIFDWIITLASDWWWTGVHVGFDFRDLAGWQSHALSYLWSLCKCQTIGIGCCMALLLISLTQKECWFIISHSFAWAEDKNQSWVAKHFTILLVVGAGWGLLLLNYPVDTPTTCQKQGYTVHVGIPDIYVCWAHSSKENNKTSPMTGGCN